MKKRVTLKDIAKEANVSEAAVSLVLNDAPSRISEAKREEIKAVAKKLNYQPNLMARSLTMRRSNTIGIIIPDLKNPYFSGLAKSVEEKMREEGILSYIASSNDITENDSKLIQSFRQHQVDGIVYCPAMGSYELSFEKQQELVNAGLPFVMVDRIFEGILSNQVIYDNELGGYLATKRLLDKGCKRVACFTGSLKTFNGKSRLNGYMRALKEYQQVFYEEDVYEGDYRFGKGYEFGLDVVGRPEIDGVFASNDLMAFGLLRAMQENNIDRETIQVVGYDQLSPSKHLGIQLESISQPVEALASQAVHQLLKQIEDPSYAIQTILDPKFE